MATIHRKRTPLVAALRVASVASAPRLAPFRVVTRVVTCRPAIVVAAMATVLVLVSGCQLDPSTTADAPPASTPAPDALAARSDASTPSGGTSAAPVSTPAQPVATVAASLPAAFDAIATRTKMTPEARSMLAQSNPTLVERASLGTACPLEPDVSVLGCYRSGHIAVLHLTDSKLDGLTEAITAHEMLHAAWSSLSDADRQRLGLLLEAAYAKAATPELTERIGAYRTRDPSSVDNELHSILGTEVANVGAELETWYQRWFTSRKTVVKLASGAQSTLTSLEKQVNDLDSRLGKLRTQIETEETALDTQRTDLETQAAALEALKADGQIADYNAGVDPFNLQVDAYNTSVSDHKALVDKHNGLVQKRNDLAASYTDLVAQITTTAKALPSS